MFVAVGVYPILANRTASRRRKWLIDRQLKLGLDLQGGVHLVLRVQTDDALRLETEAEMERLREALEDRRHHAAPSRSTAPPSSRSKGPPDQDAAFRQAATAVETNFDRSSGGGGTYTFTMKPNVQVTLVKRRSSGAADDRAARQRAGRHRAEHRAAGRHGDQILVQLPGVTDVNRAKEIIRSTGLLELKIVEQGRSASREALLANGQVPAGMEIVPGQQRARAMPRTVYYLVQRAAAVEGRDLRSARPGIDENGRPAVSFTFNTEARRKFGKVTGENIGRSWPSSSTGACIRRRASTGGSPSDGIIGQLHPGRGPNLSLVLRSGSLPASLTYLEERTSGRASAPTRSAPASPRSSACCWSASCSCTTSSRA